MRSGEHGGRGDHDGGRIHQDHGQLADVGHRQVEPFHPHTAGHQSLGQIIDHERGAAVHGHKGQHHQVLRRVQGPVGVGLEDPGRLVVHLAVAGGDQVDLQTCQLLQVLGDNGPEGQHDLAEVALGRLVHPALVGHEQVAGGDVRAEEVAAEEDTFLFQVAAHGLRPVDPGGVDETQGPVAKGQGLAVGHGPHPVLGQLQVIHQQGLALGRSQDLRLGVALEQHGDGAGVVLLGVLADDVVDPGGVAQLVEQHLGHGRVDRVEQGGFLAAFDQVGVVGGAVGQGHERVEQPPVPVHRAHPEDAVSDLPFVHGDSSVVVVRAVRPHRWRGRAGRRCG